MCVRSDVASFEVRKPAATHLADAADASNLHVLEDQGSFGFGVTVRRKSIPVSIGEPNGATDFCSGPLNIVVPLWHAGGSPVRNRKRISVSVTTSAGKRDVDVLKLMCRPSTCGNGVLEADHEQCDDGNRFDGDGCDSHCQIEP